MLEKKPRDRTWRPGPDVPRILLDQPRWFPKLRQLSGERRLEVAIAAAARHNDMGHGSTVTHVLGEAADKAAREPRTDDEYVEALAAQDCRVEDHGDDTFTLRTGRGGATDLASMDFSSALAEAWDLVKP